MERTGGGLGLLGSERLNEIATQNAELLAFDVIHESDRDAIVGHVVEVQRALIRSRSRGPGTE